MGKPSKLIRFSNNIFECMLPINKTNGCNGSHQPNLPTKTPLIPPPNSCPSKLFMVETQLSLPFTQHLLNLLPITLNKFNPFNCNFEPTSKKQTSAIRSKQTDLALWLQPLQQEIKYGLMLATFAALAQLANSPKESLAPLKQNQSSPLTPLNLLYLQNGKVSTRSFMCLSQSQLKSYTRARLIPLLNRSLSLIIKSGK